MDAFEAVMPVLHVKAQQPGMTSDDVVPVQDHGYLSLDRDCGELFHRIVSADTIVLCKPVQSGKTREILEIISHTYKTSITIFLSMKNTALAGQTNARGIGQGWQVKDFRDINSPLACMKYLQGCKGKKKLAHFLMEVKGMETLLILLSGMDETFTLIVDEADMNKNVSSDKDEREVGEVEETTLPPITRAIFACKNVLRAKNNGSKTILVTATPQSIMVAEKDESRLYIYKQAFLNHIGPGENKIPDLELVPSIAYQTCKTRDRWTGNRDDRGYNSYRLPVRDAVARFESLGSKDTSIKQLMLISLENRNIAQALMAEYVQNELTQNIDIIVFNGENKDKNYPLLSDRIRAAKSNKVIIISGFMASRGVSFTDFSDDMNQHELVLQIHAAKREDPLNSSLQAMRIFGPARRTVVRPILYCNQVTLSDVRENFTEMYRICRDLAMGKTVIARGRYDTKRPLCQNYCFRYMNQSSNRENSVLLFASSNQEDHKPIMEM